MGCRELIESLRAAGDERMKALRAEAEQEAERIRAESSRRIGEIEAVLARKRAAAEAEHEEKLMAEANAAVRKARLTSDRVLADRLYRLARGSLASLRNVGYRDVFGAFVRELPRFSWKTVRVNPDDVELARKTFPGAEIVPEPGITGGLEAASDGDRVRVVNTFEKRLDRMWEEMLPDIMREIAEKRK